MYMNIAQKATVSSSKQRAISPDRCRREGFTVLLLLQLVLLPSVPLSSSAAVMTLTRVL
jgi:hypothetical protein